MDGTTAKPPVTATKLGTRVLVMGASTWMSMGTLTQVLPRADNHMPISSPRCMPLDPSPVNRSLQSLITDTIRGLLTTPREDRGTTSLLETASENANTVNTANAAGIVIVTGSVDVATNILNLIPPVHLPPSPIPTLLSRPVPKTSL